MVIMCVRVCGCYTPPSPPYYIFLDYLPKKGKFFWGEKKKFLNKKNKTIILFLKELKEGGIYNFGRKKKKQGKESIKKSPTFLKKKRFFFNKKKEDVSVCVCEF